LTVTQTTQNKRVPPAAILKLWMEYKETGDVKVRDRVVFTLAPIVKYIVYRKVREIPAHCEIEDFISSGVEALIQSIERYDPAKGATLEQFAWIRIHGAVLDELRRNDWAPRSLRRWERDISGARERFMSLYGRTPSKQELSEALGISPSELTAHLDDIARSDVTSLNTFVTSDDDISIERIDTLPSSDMNADPEFSAMRENAKERFREAFDCLPARDRAVAVLLYVNNLTLRESGEVLGTSESRVCQIHGQLKRKLREQLDGDVQLFVELAA
jgi:RNA polymerase sigma factor for flagellar operon FliA